MNIPDKPLVKESRGELVDLRLRVKKLEDAFSSFRRKEVTAEEALRFAEGILETIREPFLVLAGDLRVSSANKAFYEGFRVSAEDTLGRHIRELGNGQWDDPRLLLLLRDVVPGDLQVDDFQVHNDFPAIGRRVMLLNARRFERDTLGTQCILLTIEDVTDRKRFEEELTAAAVTDPLTGLQNRRGMSAQADKLFAKSRGSGKGFDLLFVDLDGLKTINDRFGHSEGDRAIVDVATVLRANFRESDVIARVGGDEFVVAPAGVQDEDREAILLRLQAAVEAYVLGASRPFKLSVSAGLAAYDPGSARLLDEILAEGDAAMYEQKQRRRPE